MDQHQHLEYEAVSNGKQECQFNDGEDDDGAAEAYFPRDQKTERTTGNVTQGIYNRVAVITEGRRLRSISVNDELGILK